MASLPSLEAVRVAIDPLVLAEAIRHVAEKGGQPPPQHQPTMVPSVPLPVPPQNTAPGVQTPRLPEPIQPETKKTAPRVADFYGEVNSDGVVDIRIRGSLRRLVVLGAEMVWAFSAEIASRCKDKAGDVVAGTWQTATSPARHAWRTASNMTSWVVGNNNKPPESVFSSSSAHRTL